ncbi:MAG: GPW/gp25 family protein [Lentisphaeraceae bacterium]|nr:GPW/gp25 family protein [Lentisphaeraceae bacterium]
MSEENTVFDLTNEQPSVIGKGWSFPPTFERGSNSIKMVTQEQDIQESLTLLLNTSLGERFLQPDYGCNLRDYLFESLTSSMECYIEDLVKRAIIKHEPRIKLLDFTLIANELKGVIELNVSYLIRSTNSRYNFVYPFYLSEGTELK